MSQQTPPPGAGGEQQPSEEEVRQYLAQLRQAPAEQVIAEVLSGLLNAAQVKVGRKDGRLLLDLSSQVIDSAREHLSDELTNQVDEVLGQLRMAQVEGEKEVGEGEQEQNDLGSQPPAGGEQTGQAPPTDPPASGGAQDGGGRLWTPGS